MVEALCFVGGFALGAGIMVCVAVAYFGDIHPFR